MRDLDEEEDFPREAKPSVKPDFDGTAFKGIKSNKNVNGKAPLTANKFKRAFHLSRKTIKEGILALAAVREVTNEHVVLSLPGRLRAILSKDSISTPYSSLIEKCKQGEGDVTEVGRLQDLFLIGQHLNVKVGPPPNSVGVNWSVPVSSDPRVVNQGLTFASLSPGFVFQGAIHSVEDHGYLIYLGLQGIHAFLPSKKAQDYIDEFNNRKPLRIGQIFWFLVQKSELNHSKNTIIVSIDPDEIAKAKISDCITLERLTPGNQVVVINKRVVPEGLIVSFGKSGVLGLSDEFEGFVPYSHLTSPYSKPSDYQPGIELKATILYKLPITNYMELSFRATPYTRPKQDIKVGTVVPDCQVTGVIPCGSRGVCVYFQMSSNYQNLFGVLNFLDRPLYELVQEYPVGSSQNLQVRAFDYLEQLYIVSLYTDPVEPNVCYLRSEVVKEELTSLAVGDRIHVKVESVNKDGCIVSFNDQQGVVPRIHSTHNQDECPKISIGTILEGRVLCLEPKLKITLRQEMLSCPLVQDLKTWDRSKKAIGVISRIIGETVFVSFFDDCQGTLNKKDIGRYQVGDMVHVKVKSALSSKMGHLMLAPLGSHGPSLGVYYEAEVTEVIESGIKCHCTHPEMDLFIPRNHLSDFYDLCAPLHERGFPVGTTIPNATYMFTRDGINYATLKTSFMTCFRGSFAVEEGGIKVIPGIVAAYCRDEMKYQIMVLSEDSEDVIKVSPKDIFGEKLVLYRDQIVWGVVSRVANGRKYYDFKHPILSKRSTQWAREVVGDLLRDWKLLSTLPLPKRNEECSLVSASKFFFHVTFSQCPTQGYLPKAFFPHGQIGQVTQCSPVFYDIFTKVVYVYVGPHKIRQKYKSKIPLKSDEVLEGVLVHRTKHLVISVVVSGSLKGQVVYCLVYNSHVFHPIYVRFMPGLPCKIWGAWSYDNYLVCSPDNITTENMSVDFVTPVWLKSEESKHYIDVAGNELNKEKKKVDHRRAAEIEEWPDKEKKKFLELKKGYERNITMAINKEAEETLGPSKDEAKKKKKRKNTDEDVETKKAKVGQHQLNLDGIVNNIDIEEAANFVWEATPVDLAKAVSNGPTNEPENFVLEELDEESKSKPSGKQKTAKEVEKEIAKKEKELLTAERNPASAEHFERLVLAHPNNSKLWIKYMAYFVQAAELDKARAIGKKALTKINYREEQERLNVSLAILNLDFSFATPEDFEASFELAKRTNDEFKVESSVLSLFAANNKPMMVQNLVNKMVRKYKEKQEMWVHCFSSLMIAGCFEKARSLFQRALTVLPKRTHVPVTVQFALCEGKANNLPEACSLFENILTSFPGRTDVWFVYIDMLVSKSLIDDARSVLERVTSHSLPIKKARSIYFKWLKFEETHGTPESVKRVKDIAASYVKNLTEAYKTSRKEQFS